MRPFRNRQLKNALFRSPLQGSAILSLMRIPLDKSQGLSSPRSVMSHWEQAQKLSKGSHR
jgi:hypothetical protein